MKNYRSSISFILFLLLTKVACSQYLGGPAQRDEEERLRHKKLISAADIRSCELYSVSCYDGVFKEPGSLANELTYDAKGNPVLEIRHNLDGGKNTEYRYQYDSSDRIIFESFGPQNGPAYNSHYYTYSRNGKLEQEKVVEPGAKFSVYMRTYTYSVLGILLVETITDTLGHVLKKIEYSCNGAGYVLSAKEQRADGSAIFTTNYTYDKKNRLILASEEDKDGKAGDEMKYTYDKQGRLVQESFVSKFGMTYLEYLYKYNVKGQMEEQRENDMQDGSVTITRYRYNDYGLIATETWYDKTEKPLDRIDYYYKTRE